MRTQCTSIVAGTRKQLAVARVPGRKHTPATVLCQQSRHDGRSTRSERRGYTRDMRIPFAAVALIVLLETMSRNHNFGFYRSSCSMPHLAVLLADVCKQLC